MQYMIGPDGTLVRDAPVVDSSMAFLEARDVVVRFANGVTAARRRQFTGVGDQALRKELKVHRHHQALWESLCCLPASFIGAVVPCIFICEVLSAVLDGFVLASEVPVHTHQAVAPSCNLPIISNSGLC